MLGQTYIQNNYAFPCASSCAPPFPKWMSWASCRSRLMTNDKDGRKTRVKVIRLPFHLIYSQTPPKKLTVVVEILRDVHNVKQ